MKMNEDENMTNGDAKDTPKKKKLAVVFRSQNSVSHKERIEGFEKNKKPGEENKPAQKASPNGRPLPPGTARVTPLKKLNEIQKAEEEAARKAEAEAKAKSEEKKQGNGVMNNKGAKEQSFRNDRTTASRPDRGDSRRRDGQQDRRDASSDRPQRGNREGGVRGSKPQNGDRPFGDRPQRNGDRPQRSGDRPQRGGFADKADRPERNDRGERREGRSEGRRSGGDRDRFSKSAAATAFAQPSKNADSKKRAARKNEKYDKNKNFDNDEMTPKKQPKKTGKGAFIKPEPKKEEPVEEIKQIVIPEVLTVKELADRMKMQPSAIIKKLFMQGQILTPNSELSYEEAENIALEYDILCEKEQKVDVIAELLKDEEDDEEKMVQRPPVVCVMGHVDHGKTSILDAIRKTNVTSHEAGGITQHIGAYQVKIADRLITFLDTPGHEAFTAMRMRGAQSTDIAILVVAADDGVKPQTVEAINHAKAAGVEIVVAINKIDKPAANIERVKQELSEYELIPEDWGGSTVFVPVSAKTGEGIKNLLEMILLTADVMELKANPNRNARGIVIEAELDKGKGPVARVLVQKGTLHIGDTVAAGACYGKVRAMMDDKGKRVKLAGPSTPVEILGLNDVPNAGEILVETDGDKEAKAFAQTFITENKQKLVEESKHKVSLDALFEQIQAGNLKELPIIIKADVQGSVEAVKESLSKLSNEEVVVKVIHSAVGAINESDVTLASASNAIIIGFNVKPDNTAKSIADREHVDIRLYSVIYKAIEDLQNALNGMLAPVYEEKVIGHAVVRQTFKASGVGTIAGSYVLDGIIQRGAKARITRGKDQIFEGNIESVKRFKDDVKEVKTGYECGLVFEKFNDIQEDDQIEVYIMEEVKRS